MRQLVWGLAMVLSAGLPFLASAPQPALAAANCACLDMNGDDACGNPADIVVNDSDWLKGPLSGAGGNFPGKTFVVPAGCSIILDTAPKGGVVINAQRVVFRGEFRSTPTGGEGLQLNASQDIVVEQASAPAARPHLESGGANKLATTLANAAIAKSSVALKAGGSCSISNADLRGNPVTGSGQVGIQCAGTITLSGTSVIAAGIDIQSLTGAINGNASPSPGPGPQCTSFPCVVPFASTAAIDAFCTPPSPPPGVPNQIQALNNPLVMIAATDLRLDTPSAPGNLIEGRFLINLVAVNGNVQTANATVTNHNSGPPAGGAKIWVFADPTTVARSPVLKEKSTGPSIGTIGIGNACYRSFNVVRYGGVLSGTPAPPPCEPLDHFTPVASGP